MFRLRHVVCLVVLSFWWIQIFTVVVVVVVVAFAGIVAVAIFTIVYGSSFMAHRHGRFCRDGCVT
jgi:UPF0716 family protein affecting phage T7 exclusion